MGNKKDFKNAKNPALQFISSAEDPMEKSEKSTDKVKKEKKETKSKRLNLVIRPSLNENIAKIAHMNQISPNEQISRCLEEYVENHKDIIKKYDEIFK